MDSRKDYYAILGVLADAEDIVIRAAYRALAQRYHPDKGSGNRERMAEINEAYAVLSDAAKRKEYDASRGSFRGAADSYAAEDEREQGFGDAQDSDALTADWNIARKYHPDIDAHFARLRKVSKKLAFVYRAVLVETKAYSRRAELAASMEQDFLQRYFGKNKEILGFAGRIIEQGNKAAARELNNAVRVLGNDLDAETVIRRIDREYLINPSPPPPPSSTFCTLVRKLEARPDGDTYAWDDWVALVELMGGTVYEKSGLFLNTMTVCFGDSEEVFNNGISAVRWIQKHVLPLAMKRVRSGEARG